MFVLILNEFHGSLITRQYFLTKGNGCFCAWKRPYKIINKHNDVYS
jgi:hypothetical protein